MDDILTLPTGPLADASLAIVRSSESHPIVDHSIRSFLFARMVAEHEGCLTDAAYDEQPALRRHCDARSGTRRTRTR